MTLSRDEIREAVDCPECGEPAGLACLYEGSRALGRMLAGKNHFARMQAAQAKANSEADTKPLIEPQP